MGISSGIVVDRAGMGRLPVGIEDFERVVGEFVYVDKSLLVRDLVDSDFNAVLFCRPRRFGKSLAMRMLQCYVICLYHSFFLIQICFWFAKTKQYGTNCKTAKGLAWHC